MKNPTVIQFPVNNICNSRCQMCDIWQQRKGREITPLELRKVLSDPVFSEVRAVGMNGGEPTLRQDLADLAREICNGLPKLRSISLITNGLKPHLVIPRTTELFAVTKAAGVKLDIMLSLDGVDDVHDRVRGRRGNFSAVEECLKHFRENKIGDSHRLGCTLISENVEDAERLMLWAEKQEIYCRFRVGIPHQRLYTKDKIEPFALTIKQQFHLCNFLDTLIARYELKNISRRLFLRNLRNQIAYNHPRANGCAWQEEGITLLSDGSFAYCAVESPTLGNPLVEGESYGELYLNNKVSRDEILKTKCEGCLHDYEGRFPGLKDRLLTRASQAAKKFHIPLKPLLVLGNSASLAKSSFNLLPRLPDLNSKSSVSLGSENILITGWYGTETLGDKAILFSIIQELINAGVSPSKIFVASIEPYVTEFTLSEFSPLSNCSVLPLMEAKSIAKRGGFAQVIFGGGPIMSSIGYLCDIASIFSSVKHCGGQAIIWGCGLGPIRSLKRDLFNKLAISKILRSADFCVFRDQKSLNLAKKFVGNCIVADSRVALDPAFHWVKSQPRADKQSEAVGFAIRSLPVAEYFSDFLGDVNNFAMSFNNKIVSVMESHRKEGPVYLQCMHRLPCGGDDRLYYNDILGENIQSFDFSFEHRSPSEDVMRLSSLSVLYAMRFHSVVFAVALGIPVIPIDYTNGGKISSLCKTFGIRCWLPDEIVELNSSGGEMLQPQVVDPEILNSIASKSSVVYARLARKVASFVVH
ncbi:MAG: polysaccharide pyruvyl transferase family protein [Synechococcus sp.]